MPIPFSEVRMNFKAFAASFAVLLLASSYTDAAYYSASAKKKLLAMMKPINTYANIMSKSADKIIEEYYKYK